MYFFKNLFCFLDHHQSYIDHNMTSNVFPSRYMSSSEEIPLQIHGWLRIHKNGRCERLVGNDIIPPGMDPLTGVQSKDIIISPNVSIRLYIPKSANKNRKLPTLIYYHGGGFVTECAGSSTYHPTLNLISSETNMVAISVNYRLAPEHLIPIAYEDAWEAMKWVAIHLKGNGHESWLNDYADLHNVYLCGDSVGANIAHNMAIRVGLELDPCKVVKLEGLILLHPFFGGKEPIGSEFNKHQQNKAFVDHLWMLANPVGVDGLDDPLFNPSRNPNISSLGCSKILVCVGEKDGLRDRGLNYKKIVEKSGWKGVVKVFESKGAGHVFFLHNRSCKNASILRKNICSFVNVIRSKS
uniref:probable carboxylesterase 12 n=1 Tax=Erigeron canadensis TaxID=72917 RepID=UPI001CB9C6D2|nr:probable carboxylesterase 12 [Erigeron canadensis]